ncbi:hypothetical protein GLYMA_07G074200v4 [Glycine max]|uniref:Uncharacterized protein n=1 Tax=Glycine max TaxID=3847 RepID=A0A0R0J0I2_SOYBN|nr:hypothetical protein JHK85_018261 [Glycine max]KAG5037026.1 hypothetical protein JHK86_017866 [Glycine max]KRH48199.1 hypothetical protein GLYMA_07G074200v4 [Glycine max]
MFLYFLSDEETSFSFSPFQNRRETKTSPSEEPIKKDPTTKFCRRHLNQTTRRIIFMRS